MAKRGIITITTSGSMKHVEKLYKQSRPSNLKKIFDYYGKRGVELLSLETPVDTGKTAASWSYEISSTQDGYALIFNNSSTAGNTTIPVVLLIQYGHATRNGGYVAPYDFINPVTKKLMEELANDLWREVTLP